MKRKYLIAVLLAVIFVFTFTFTACGGEETGWTIPSDGGRITASLEDNGKYGFILNVEGQGAMQDYSSKKDAPWYGKSGRITGIAIFDGITAVAANAFTDCRVEYVIIPESVTAIGANAFNELTNICAYAPLKSDGGLKIYLYSETAPTAEGDFWRFENGVPEIWREVKQDMKVLFIGNSFTYYNDIPQLFGKIAEGAGVSVTVESVTQGSWFLTKFADPADEYGRIVDEKLSTSDDYDVIVLQEQSTRPIDNYAKFSEGAKSLQAKINQTQDNCKIYLYATWGYPEEAQARGITVPEMELRLRGAYDRLAGELGLSVSHVGTAFSKVYTEYPQYNLYHSDNRHPSYIGSFLSACVHAAGILNIDPSNSDFTGKLDGETASVLKSVAQTTARG